jgi:hypothetical protein
VEEAMKRKSLIGIGLAAALAVGGVVGSFAVAEPAKDAAAAGQPPQMQLPPGWTMADMQACIEAGTPGPMHQWLAKGAGTWQGKTTMWMYPGSEPMVSECKSVVTPFMDGRYVKCEMSGDMPGMGPFNGFGLYGYDNVAGKFVSTWVDNHSSGIMNGTGELSSDGKQLTWKFEYMCPVTKKPAVMREVETITGENTKTLEMWTVEPKSGKEYQMCKIEFTRKA